MTHDEIFLLDQIEHPVFVLEPDLEGLPRYVAFNRFARKILGQSLDNILGKTAAELYSGRMGQVATERHLATLSSGEVTVHTIILPVDDGERMIRTVLRPVKQKDGRVSRIIATSTDASARHTLRDVRTHLPDRSEDMEHFIHLAAHDLRAPMRHVATLADMMREDFADLGPERLELVDLLEDVSSKTLALIGDLLSHAQAGTVENTVSRFQVGALISDIETIVDPFGTCSISRPEGWIIGDRTACQVVLRNLIDNAIKYAAQTGDSDVDALHLSLSVTALDPAHLSLCLRDNGPGFDAYTLEHLADGAFTAQGGYGLMAVQRLIAARGGHFHAANRTDRRGAEISVTLPGQWQPDEEEQHDGGITAVAR